MLPRRTLFVRTTPRERIEWLEPGTILVFAAEESRLRIKNIAPILRALLKHRRFLSLAQLGRNLTDAEITICGIGCFSNRLIHAISGQVVQLEIVFYALATNAAPKLPALPSLRSPH